MKTRFVTVIVEVRGEVEDQHVADYLSNLNDDFESQLATADIEDDPWAVVDITLAPKE